MQQEGDPISAKRYAPQLEHLGDRLAQLDPEVAREVLEELTDITEALLSEHVAGDRPLTSLDEMYGRLGLER